MKNKFTGKKINGIYTDMALEARELHPDLPGIVEQKESIDGIEISRITIQDEASGQQIGKLPGQYITIDAPNLITRDPELFKKISQQISKEVVALLTNISAESTVLVVGLGNRYVTPDSLGPRVIEKVYVTRHITNYLPKGTIDMALKSVCALAPGVLGVTGIETYDIVEGLVANLKPDAVILIDSLASRRAARINTSIQITDTGISPGSGVGNTRADLSQKGLGVPTIAIGVPMVVFASTIAQDTIHLIANKTGLHSDEEKLVQLAQEVISESMGEFIVTPKDIDSIINDMAQIIAEGINFALHGENTETLGEILS